MNDRSRKPTRTRLLAAVLCLVGASLLSPANAPAENIPVSFYISPADDGLGGSTVYLTSTFAIDPFVEILPLTFPVWADAGTAAGGQGLFSVQDVLLSRTDGFEFIFGHTVQLDDFTCTAPSCQVGPRPDAEVDLLFAAGDDTSSTPTLTGRFRVGYLTVTGALEGTVSLIAGTALDANGAGGLLEIDALPNQGTLIRFVSTPEPAVALQLLTGAGLLGALGARRRPRQEGV